MEIQCPQCGNSDLNAMYLTERVIHSRTSLLLRNGVLYVDPQKDEIEWESGQDSERLECRECLHEWMPPVPLVFDEEPFNETATTVGSQA